MSEDHRKEGEMERAGWGDEGKAGREDKESEGDADRQRFGEAFNCFPMML